MTYYTEVAADSPAYWWKLNNTSGSDTDVVASNVITPSGGVTVNQAGNGSWTGVNPCWTFSGATDGAHTQQIHLDVSTWTLEFLMSWDTFANDDRMAFEMQVDASGYSDGMWVDPNSGLGGFQVLMFPSGGSYRAVSFTRPSAGTWHHYVLVFLAGTPLIKCYVDGTLQTVTVDTAGAAGTFAHSIPFNVMCRDGQQLLGSGKVDEIAIYKSELSQARVTAHYGALAAAGGGATIQGVRSQVRALGRPGSISRTGGLISVQGARAAGRARGRAGSTGSQVTRYAGLYNYYRSGHGDTGYQIGSAFSTDKLTWVRATEPAIPHGTGWESVDVAQPYVVDVAGVLYCWYSGYSGAVNGIGLARSYDNGLTWQKYGGNPVIAATLGFEGSQCYIPAVLYDTADTDANKRFKIWYCANGGAAMGYATSPDGITWTKKTSSVLGPIGSGWEQSLVSPQGVVKEGSTYYLFYAGYGAAGSNYPVSVGLVMFTDPAGLYTRSANNPVLSPDGKQTTLTAQCTAGATQITVASSTTFPVGCPIWIFDPTVGGNRFLTQVASKPDGTHINLSDTAPVTVPNSSSVTSAAWHSVCSSGTPWFDGSNWRTAAVGFKGGGDIDNRLAEQAMQMYGAALNGAWSLDYARGLALPVPVSETTGTHMSTENLSFAPYAEAGGTIPPGPVANFTGTPLTIPSGGSVHFTDLSTNTPTGWVWQKSNNGGATWQNFQSGGSHSQNPTEVFT